MPSKKKVRGRKARQSKAAATVSVEEVNTHREPECKHFAAPDHRTKDDILQCKAVFDGLRDKFHSHFVTSTLEGAALPSTVLGEIIDEVKEEYNDTVFSIAKRRELCRADLISLGTGDCLKLLQADESTNIIYSWFCTLLAATHKALHHCETGFGIGSVVDLDIFISESVESPRELVRYFHRNNSCQCLQKLHDKLKASTERRAHCFRCHVFKEIKYIFRCSRCDLAQYCSRACQVSVKP